MIVNLWIRGSVTKRPRNNYPLFRNNNLRIGWRASSSWHSWSIRLSPIHSLGLVFQNKICLWKMNLFLLCYQKCFHIYKITIYWSFLPFVLLSHERLNDHIFPNLFYKRWMKHFHQAFLKTFYSPWLKELSHDFNIFSNVH